MLDHDCRVRFFSSRRRHTRYWRDWSSDVCSSDLVDFNPRFVAERIVDSSAVTMGATAENLHDRFPSITKEHADHFAVRSHQKLGAAWENGVMRDTEIGRAHV